MSVAVSPSPYPSGGNTSSNGQALHLPKIAHPTQRMGDPNSLNVNARSVSRASSLGELVDRYRNESNRPRANQELRESSFIMSNRKSNRNDEENLTSASFNIPENVRAIYTPDVNKVSIPIFGSRPATTASSSMSTSRTTASAQIVDVEDYLNLLRDKVRNNFHEIKTKFRNADQDGRNGVSREALAHIIAAILGPSKPLSHQHFLRLLERLGLKNKSVIKYEDFASCFQDNKSESSSSEWCDPVRSSNSAFQPAVSRKATQVMLILKEKANYKTKDMTSLVPQLLGGFPNRIFKLELFETLTRKMSIKIEEEEFEKLWKKLDHENSGFVKSELFLKRLGVTLETPSKEAEEETSEDQSANSIPHANVTDFKVAVSKQSSMKSLHGRLKNPIEKWLKRQFRDGFTKMKSTFEEMDLQRTGQVRRDQFLNVLRQFGFKLEFSLLDAFLNRCGIHVSKNSNLINYYEFLERFQNRSDQGFAYQIITSGDLNEDKSVSEIGSVERKLIKMFQNGFLGLLQIFRKIDRNKSNTISKQEFRAALESHFGIELSDAEFESFYKEVPKDGSNRIKYLDFMTKFDSDSTSTLFDSQSTISEEFRPKMIRKREYDPILEENEELDSPRTINPNGRNIHQLYGIIKEKIRNNHKEVESAWNEVDVSNSNEMNKDMLHQLLRKLRIPNINRDEIELIWSNFILKDNKKLDYWQFVRHFGYSKKSAAFENSKISPPKKGDNDMMLTSNKLGRDSILIRGSVQAKLKLLYEPILKSFEEIDPHKTKLLLKEEFEEILNEICSELNLEEMDYICSKYENPSDGRINYIDFLTPYAPRRLREKSEENQRRSDDLASSRVDSNDTIIIKLRSRLSDNYKELRRLFKQYDFSQSGFVNIKSFKDTLKSAKCSLSDEEMFSLMRHLDKDASGMINYSKFINEIIKP